MTAGYLVFRQSSSNPARRSTVLYSMLFSSIFLWAFLGAGLVVCTMFLGQYEEGRDGILRLVFGGSLLTSLVASGAMTVLARRVAIPRALTSLRRGSHPIPSLRESFDGLARRMRVRAVLEEADTGNAFSISLGGQNVVAVSNEVVRSLSPEETEAVLAHELSHIKNHDSRAKGLARLARLAFPFDPVLRLVEAAVHRERELLADRASVAYTQKPLALASALLKACQAPSLAVQGSVAGLCVGGHRQSLLSLYPDLEKRIEMLVDLAKRMRIERVLEASP